MTFLAPALLLALPLAALPVIIHLIHLYRRRQVKWAAMMFLLAAQRMNKGFSRLRQILILSLRVLAVASIIFVVTRPLSGGWLGLTGGAPDTVLILVDRSASMEQKNTALGISKREAGLRNVAKAITDAVGTRSRLVLIDSALGKPLPLDKADALLLVPQSEATDTEADIPGLLQNALDYIVTNKTGRTDVWLLSDLRQSVWDSSSGRWQTLRSAFATMQGVRFHLLSYPQPAPDDLAVTIDRVARNETAEKAELSLDLRIVRHAVNPQPLEVPLSFVINGTATTTTVELKENQLVIQGYSIPIDKSLKHGWGRVELPADSCPENDQFYFVFDETPPLHSVIVSDDNVESGPLNAALSAAADPSRKYVTTVLSAKRAAEIPWDDAALIVWDAAIPKPDDALARQLQDFVAAGRTILFLPPDSPDDTKIFGLGWGPVGRPGHQGKPLTVDWWRNDDDLLANTRDGAALPVGTLEISRLCGIVGDGIPLARINEAGSAAHAFAGPGRECLFSRHAAGAGVIEPGAGRRGDVRAAPSRAEPGRGDARQGAAALRVRPGAGSRSWKMASGGTGKAKPRLPEMLPLRAGVFSSGDRLVALNRPPGEDQPQTLSTTELDELFAGLDYHVLNDTLENGRSLTNEVWRTFLVLVALALVGEALLCMPPRRELPPGKNQFSTECCRSARPCRWLTAG